VWALGSGAGALPSVREIWLEGSLVDQSSPPPMLWRIAATTNTMPKSNRPA
jgi:hypothetical protein